MSPQLIAHSSDLTRLRNEGYSIRIVAGYLVVDDVPFVDDEGAVHRDGVLIIALTTAGNTTVQPSDHTAWFGGGVPCSQGGDALSHIINNTRAHDFGHGLIATCYLSAKPRTNRGRYNDHHHKVSTYVGHIAGPAQAIDAEVTARVHRPITTTEDQAGPFRYVDTASSRAGIEALNEAVSAERVGIVGLGGTGQYLLDAVAKAPVAEIHVFDADDFLTHNAFRSPGAPTVDELAARPLKVNHFGDVYDRLHRNIHRHPTYITADNVAALGELTFVFVAIDDPEAKEPIVEFLIDREISFIDVGMGLEVVDERITGTLRATLVTPARSHHAGDRIGTTSVGREDDAYRSNIQIVELNMLNAAMAVMAWKRYRSFYADWDGPHHSLFSIASNRIANDEWRDEGEDPAGEES